MMLRMILAGACASLATGAAAAQSERWCGLISPESAQPVPLIGVNVLERAQRPGAFHLNTPARMEVTGVYCVRDAVVPTENDYKIVLAGYTLVLELDDGTDREARVLLDLDDDQFRLRVAEGGLTAEERDLATRRIEGYYTAVGEPAI